jgi:hypothetical protein
MERAWTFPEMGAGICGAAPAQAGVHHLDHGLPHEGWKARLIGEVRWEHADQRLAQKQDRHERVGLIHDRSVREQAEREQKGMVIRASTRWSQQVWHVCD